MRREPLNAVPGHGMATSLADRGPLCLPGQDPAGQQSSMDAEGLMSLHPYPDKGPAWMWRDS